jgi:phage/plasmid primase-like uncharacterized protein
LALANNPVAAAKIEALYREILDTVAREQAHMTAVGCVICGSKDRVRPIFDHENAPCMCRYHRGGWGVTFSRFRYAGQDKELHFAKWLAKNLIKQANHAAQ